MPTRRHISRAIGFRYISFWDSIEWPIFVPIKCLALVATLLLSLLAQLFFWGPAVNWNGDGSVLKISLILFAWLILSQVGSSILFYVRVSAGGLQVGLVVRSGLHRLVLLSKEMYIKLEPWGRFWMPFSFWATVLHSFSSGYVIVSVTLLQNNSAAGNRMDPKRKSKPYKTQSPLWSWLPSRCFDACEKAVCMGSDLTTSSCLPFCSLSQYCCWGARLLCAWCSVNREENNPFPQMIYS